MSISAVERDTGLTKDTLRVWERRYGFPRPVRDGYGERVYTQAEVDKLRVVRRLLDAGHRPGKIIGLPVPQLMAMADGLASTPGAGEEADSDRKDLARYVELVRTHRVDELRKALSQAALRQGLERFVVDLCAPLTRAVGEAWARGALEIFEEHLYTESMQVVLRNAIGNIPEPGSRPRVLLTTFPNEPHGLGLLMAEAILALDGCRCTSLGTQTPIWDIALAAGAQQVDIVALSFSGCLSPKVVVEGLADLRARLPDGVEVWAGGECPVLQRRPPPRVVVLGGLADIRGRLVDWRARRLSDQALRAGTSAE